jgi:hypothetical protein
MMMMRSLVDMSLGHSHPELKNLNLQHYNLENWGYNFVVLNQVDNNQHGIILEK